MGRPVTYVVHYGVLTTGGEISELPVSTASFSDELRATGSFNATVAVGQCGTDGALWQATRGALTFWAAEWADNFGRRIVAAGPIWSRDGSDDGITFGGSNMFSVFDHRKLIDQTWTDAQISTNALTYPSFDLGTIIKHIVQQVATSGTAVLPLVFEADRAGTSTRTYQGYDLLWARDKITEIGNVESGTGGLGGPDWLFTPRFKAGDFTHVEWVLTTGTAAQPWITQTGAVVTLDRGAANQQIVGTVKVHEDASNLATNSYCVGGGSQKAKVIASTSDATLTNLMYPRMDAEQSSNANDTATITAYAQGMQSRRGRTPSAVTVDVNASWWWAQGGAVGTTVRLIDPRHAVFGPIDLTSRVTKWSVSDIASEWVTLTLADSLTEI